MPSRHYGRGKGTRGGKKKTFFQPGANFGRDIPPRKVQSALRSARLQLHRKGDRCVTVDSVVLAVLDHFDCENERELVARIQIDQTTGGKNQRTAEVLGLHDFSECVRVLKRNSLLLLLLLKLLAWSGRCYCCYCCRPVECLPAV